MHLLAKMGKDVDTVLCVYGQIAGAYYTYYGIPNHLIKQLQTPNELNYYINRFVNAVLTK